NGVEPDLSSFGTEVELIATLSNSTGFNVLFLDDTFNLVTGIEAQATFTSSQLDGTTQVASITGDLTGIAGIAITSNGGGTVTGSLDSLQVIPEPSTFALLGLGAGALYLLRRRK
ncbi:MAG: PEP-CTERM sorting domain-containing protein, partial [Cyanobacteria bacterium J06656_5]